MAYVPAHYRASTAAGYTGGYGGGTNKRTTRGSKKNTSSRYGSRQKHNNNNGRVRVKTSSGSSASRTRRARSSHSSSRGNGARLNKMHQLATRQNMKKSITIGQYHLGKSIGQGTFGKVKLGTHTLSSEKVAIKVLQKSKIKEVADVERVSREIAILKKVNHDQVIRLFEVIDTPQAIYLIMEFCEGGELFDYIVKHRHVKEPQACKFFHQLCNGMEALHKYEITHRDLKPENLSFNGENISSMTFEWIIDGTPIPAGTNLTHIFTNSGVASIIYEVILNGWTSHGCTDSDTMYITIHPDPLAEINIGTNYATTNCAPFTIDPNVISAGIYLNANDTYTWYIEDTNGVIIVGPITGTIPPTHTMPNDADAVTVYLIATNNDSCTADTASMVFITVGDPVAEFETTNLNGCHPFQPNINSLSDPGLIHEWFIDGTIYTPTDPLILDYLFTNTSNTNIQTYQVQLVVQAGGSGGLPCTDTIINTVTVYPKPFADFNPTIGNQCAPACDDLIDASIYQTSATIIWNWTITGTPNGLPATPTTSNSQDPNICFPDNQSGTDVDYNIELIIEDTYGCKDTAIQNIIIYTRPIANFSIVDTGCGEITYTPIDSSQNAVVWNWISTPSNPSFP